MPSRHPEKIVMRIDSAYSNAIRKGMMFLVLQLDTCMSVLQFNASDNFSAQDDGKQI